MPQRSSGHVMSENELTVVPIVVPELVLLFTSVMT
jgi:hypothetical protein